MPASLVAHHGDVRVERCFAFVDLCGFTAFTEHFGDERTVVVLASFRTRVREIAARAGRAGDQMAGRRGHAQLGGHPGGGRHGAGARRHHARRRPARNPGRAWPEGRSSCSRATTTSAGPPTWPPGCAMSPAPARCWPPARWSATCPAGWKRSDASLYPAHGFDRPLEASTLRVGDRQPPWSPIRGAVWCCRWWPASTPASAPDGSVQRFCSTACALSWEEEPAPSRPALVRLD